MFTAAHLVAGLLTPADTRAKQGDRDSVVDFGLGHYLIVAAQDNWGIRVAVGPGFRVVVPALGNKPAPSANQRQIFSFYMDFPR